MELWVYAGGVSVIFWLLNIVVIHMMSASWYSDMTTFKLKRMGRWIYVTVPAGLYCNTLVLMMWPVFWYILATVGLLCQAGIAYWSHKSPRETS